MDVEMKDNVAVEAGKQTQFTPRKPAKEEPPFVFDNPRIQPNTYCMVKLPSENFRVVKLIPNQTISIGKFGSFQVNDILGLPYGYTFEIQEDKRLRIIQEGVDDHDYVVGAKGALLEPEETNQTLIDTSESQTLSMAEIEEMKKQKTLSGKDIIDSVIKGHNEFHKKTAFSKEKYLRRKEQKYLRRFTPQPMCSSLLLDFYLEKDYKKVLDMSQEMLALLLSMANVRPGGKYLVVDETTGVVTAALMERMAGEGLIVVAHENEHPNLDALKYLSMPTELQERMIKSINWLQFFEPESEEEVPEKSAEQIASMKPRNRGAYFRKRNRWLELQNVNELVANQGFDGLIVASTLHPASIVERTLDALGGSRPAVVYSEYKEVVTEVSQLMLKDLRVLAPSIWESRVRKYQTILGRMHPSMTSRGGGGYLVHGTRVFPNEEVNATQVRNRKRKRDDGDKTKSLETEGKSEESVEPETEQSEPEAGEVKVEETESTNGIKTESN
ncbi:tRNA (adenine(58)-N(1))-methyltransferase non-catalytic subunit TRM6 [Yarrowia sp. C11]|nr:tRNA (adenine(58)-N(1))-methyltransferase non-catalytic subunit TRM6 [Yarrowia sp. E02]KAG5372959.1 tRNA (adenine(58)-N(1))-methyltransferase non-catalytic subunit TRM6 [Yarrowia sp. C11]